ncbi:MAG TPA: DUF1656 domain-containing protein [Oleiagrimonas sp.]|nr:DUF1656 domain-containing protein [Oleiagrimonas sp.]
MPRELAMFGAFVPSLLLVFVLSLLLLWAFNRAAGRFGWYRHVWHPALFRLALFTCIFGGLGLLMMR